MSKIIQRKNIHTAELIGYRDGGRGFGKWCEDFVQIPVYHKDEYVPKWTSMSCLPSNEDHIGRSYNTFWIEQKKVAVDALKMKDGRFVYRLIVFCWERGEGKCQIKGSKVLLFDGSVKKVEEVKAGDLLMGDDNTPRKVLSLANGTEEMFEVIPMRGESLTVTGDHILSLKHRRSCLHKHGKPFNDPDTGKVFDISLNDYMKKNNRFKQLNLLYKVPINFPEQKVSIDPYFLGMWLGDGSSGSTGVTTMDKEIVDYLQGYAKELDLHLSLREKKGNTANSYHIVGERLGLPGTNNLLNFMRDYNLINNKHIPQEYKINSRENRLKLLAGLIDSDGYLNRNSIQFTLKSKKLSEDIVFLAQSLGFFVVIKKCIKTIKSIDFSGEYYRIGISGDCSIIPVLLDRKKATPRSKWKDVLITGIKEVKSVGEQEYYGFNLDGNGRYVTGDFTVTHNSFIAVLIQLWKFFNFPRQQIMLGANSKDQTLFVHYGIMRDIILNSPKLLRIIGKRNIQEKEIRLRDSRGNIGSFIRSISTATGIVSNITGYTFSEIFDMKDPKFFTQLDGSIRNIPNALGVIDSTVSVKTHILYKLYDTFRKNKDPFLYFSHRFSTEARESDYWSPQMTQMQLDSYRNKFPPNAFAQYFQNTWESASNSFFTDEMINASHYLGKDNVLGQQQQVVDVLIRYKKRTSKEQKLFDEKIKTNKKFIVLRKNTILGSLIPIETVYSLSTASNHPRICSLDELQALAELYNSDSAILVGMDRADPLKVDLTAGARTIITIVAKMLPNSKNNPEVYIEDGNVKDYIYFLLGLFHIESSQLVHIKNVLKAVQEEYDSIETFCSERWGFWDLIDFCDSNEINAEIVSPAYGLQKAAFSELWSLYKAGKFKGPKTVIYGSKDEDILHEELSLFDHNPEKRFYGSPEKTQSKGVQDDSVYSLAWCIYGGRALTPDEFKERKGNSGDFGQFFGNKNLVGNY